MLAVGLTPTLSLDDVLADVLESLEHGRGATCVVCGSRAFAVRDRAGRMSHSCRSCSSTLEGDVEEAWSYGRSYAAARA